MLSAVVSRGAIPGMYRNTKKPFGCSRPTDSTSKLSEYMKLVKSTLTLENKNKTYRPGEIISGSFNVLSLPESVRSQEINGLNIEFEGRIFSVENDKRYFFNNGSTDIFHRFQLQLPDIDEEEENEPNHLQPLKKGQYKFAFTVPENCPQTFVGKFGSVSYAIKCVVDQTVDGSFAFKPVDVTIIPKSVPHWANHKEMIQPLFGQKTFSSFLMLGGKIQIMFNSDQKCYQPGACITFSLRVENGTLEIVKELTIQLQQTVRYKFEDSLQIEKIQLPSMENGPSVPAGTTQIWNGNIQLPPNLHPSLEDELGAGINMIAFEYSLRVTLVMGGSLLSNMSEDFPIHVGSPLQGSLSTKRRKSAYPVLRQVGGESSRNSLPVDNSRRLSMTSLAPSLPDYDTATNQEGGSNPEMPPPSYSCLDLNAEQD